MEMSMVWQNYYLRRALSFGQYSIVIGAIGAVLCTQGIRRTTLTLFRMSSSSSYISGSTSIAYVTAPSEQVASKLARSLVEKKFAACVNIVPQVKSVYEWEGKINEDSEVLMMIKTRSSRIQDIVDLIKKDHPYDCPEVISIPIDNGSEQYLKWVQNSVPAK